ncbi:hypothetical protein CHS0354_034356 [Potamilus streckersoni]|uniref:Uncharacterized protein n=1 Tax=Potamilus streckersoni TaxID=2493646 RepID=A0AAE0TJT4_9BIVA|nr:hypothetical protein CHS0354_034356 [Potamilus streckersoni]
MAEVMLSRDVFFLGAWRVHNVTDYLHRQITEQMHNKKGYPARLDVTSEGIELFILHPSGEITRQDNIPLQNVRDLTINRHVTTCLMAIVANRSKELNVLVFMCASDKDASEMVRTFQKVKSKLSGEGFNFDLKAPAGTNWTMKTSPRLHRHTREFRVVPPHEMKGNAHDGNNLKNNYSTSVSSIKVNIEDFDSGIHKEMIENRGKILFNVGVQAGADGVDDKTSTSSDFTSHSSLKDDLHQLSEEVRTIKVLLEDAGISDTQYFKRQTKANSNDEIIVTEILPESEDTNRERRHNKYDHRHDNVFSVPYHDSRSYGTQTYRDSELQRYREKDQHMPHKFVGSSLSMGSVNSAKGYYMKRVYESDNPLTTGYILVRHPGRRALRYSKGQSLPTGLGFRHSSKHSSTIEKPIEEVYGRHHPQLPISRSRLSNLQRSSAPIVLNGDYSKYRETVIGTSSDGGVKRIVPNGDG